MHKKANLISSTWTSTLMQGLYADLDVLTPDTISGHKKANALASDVLLFCFIT